MTAPAPVPVDHATDLQRLVELATQPHSITDVLRGALASLRDLVPYDLAAIFELDGDRLHLRVAEGPLADGRVRGHVLELSEFPTIRRALETRRPIPLEEHHHHGEEGDPYDGILDLPAGHSCMVVPLYAAGRSLGLITLDRSTCGVYEDEAVRLAGVYGQIVSIAMLFAEQAQLLDRYRRQVREEHRLLEQDTGRGGALATRRLEASKAESMQELLRLARRVAASDMPVLLAGETGTGKEVLAEAIHAWSPRLDGPFVKLNCAAMPSELVESELFGHVRGAFSGASRERRGRFLTANGGTILLDEIGDMPLEAQAKLLRVLQEGTFEPVGSDRSVRVDVRVIAASHVELREAVAEGRFREDLYYRLSGFPLTLPPLRERLEDLPEIAAGILGELAARHGRGPWSISADGLQRLLAHRWPGNVRELVNTLERATILMPEGEIGPAELGLVPATSSPRSRSIRATRPEPVELETFEEAQRAYFARVLTRTGGRIYGEGGAAELTGLKPTTLQSRLKKLGVDHRKFGS